MPTPRPSVRTRERASLAAQVVLAAVAAIAAVGAAPSMTASPTADRVWAALLAVTMVAAGAGSRRSAWLVASAVVLAASGGGAVVALPAAALALAFASSWLDRRHALVGATIGALLGVSAVHLPPLPVRGLPTAAVLVATAWLVASALRLARQRTRRVVGGALCAVGALGLAAVLGLAWSGGRAMRAFDSASAELRAAVRSASEDGRSLGEHLAQVEADLDEARAAMSGPLPAIADHLPLLGLQSDAIRTATDVGTDLGEASADAAEVVELRRLGFEDQRIDPDLLDAMVEPLGAVRAALARADDVLGEQDRRWLVGPVDRRLRGLQEEVSEAIPSTDLALEVLGVAPEMVGGDGPRRYLLVFEQPAEARGLGGFLAAWAEVVADDGRIELVESGSMEDLNLAPGYEDRVLRGPEDYLDRYGRHRIERYLQDATFSPDMPSVGTVMADLFEQTTGRAVDGVVAVDPVALAAMLEVTGPVRVPGLAQPLDHRNAAELLLEGQYRTWDDRTERHDVLEDVARRAFERLLGRRVLEPRRMGRILGPSVAEGRLLAWSRHDEEQAVIERLGLDGTFAVPEGGELLAVVHQNRGNNKIDVFVHRTVTYDLAWDPETGAFDGTVRMVVRNDAPTEGLPDVVIANRDDLGLPDGVAALELVTYTAGVGTELRVDGRPTSVQVGLERGARAYAVDLAVEPGGSTEVELDVEGFVTPGGELVLRWDGQPLPNRDDAVVTVTVPDGWSLSSPSWDIDAAGTAEHVFIARAVGPG